MPVIKKYTAELLMLNVITKISSNKDMMREFLHSYLGQDYDLLIRQFVNTLSLFDNDIELDSSLYADKQKLKNKIKKMTSGLLIEIINQNKNIKKKADLIEQTKIKINQNNITYEKEKKETLF